MNSARGADPIEAAAVHTGSSLRSAPVSAHAESKSNCLACAEQLGARALPQSVLDTYASIGERTTGK